MHVIFVAVGCKLFMKNIICVGSGFRHSHAVSPAQLSTERRAKHTNLVIVAAENVDFSFLGHRARQQAERLVIYSVDHRAWLPQALDRPLAAENYLPWRAAEHRPARDIWVGRECHLQQSLGAFAKAKSLEAISNIQLICLFSVSVKAKQSREVGLTWKSPQKRAFLVGARGLKRTSWAACSQVT